VPVTLTIKQVPDELAERLRAVAARNHRSLQGELLHSLEQIVAAHDQRRQRRTLEGSLDTTQPRPAQTRSASADQGGLVEALDAIVAGSQWGEAPLLSREQANDRELTREFDSLVQEQQTPYRR
jgi:plasmid stability protein